MRDAIRIYKSGVKFLVPMSVEETYRRVTKEAMKLAEGDFGTIFIADQNGNLTRTYSTDSFLLNIQPRKRGFTHQVYKTRTPKILTSSQIQKVHPKMNSLQFKSDILIPLAYQKKSLGVLSIMSQKKLYTPHDLRVLELFQPIASLSILKAMAIAQKDDAVQTRDLFISMASHEFRTPLTTINGYLELMQKKIKEDKKIPKDWIDLTYAETQRLIRMVKELLEINQIRSGKLQYSLQKCSASELVSRAVEVVKINHPRRNIPLIDKLHYTGDQIEVDFDKMLQVLTNVLNNAIKYSNNETPVSVTLDKAPQKYLKITITDKGVGIAKSDLPNIFQGFYKGSGSNKKDGLGLGLYVAKRIIDKHHGQIQITSQIGKGTTVEILLPRSK